MGFKNKVEYLIFIGFSRLIGVFGMESAKYFAKFFAFLFFYVIPVRKKVVISNLRKAFPGYPEDKIKKIAFDNYFNFAVTVVEIMCIPSLSKEELQSKFVCKDLNLIKEKYEQGNGLIFLTGHFGNWELGAIWIGSVLNIPIHVLVKKQRNKVFTKWMNRARERFGNKVIYLGLSVRELYQTIKSGGAVGIVGDQRGKRESIRISFFNQKTAAYSGAAAIALKTRVPVILAMGVRRPDFKYELMIKELAYNDLPDDKNEQIIYFTQKYFSAIQEFVEKYPDQWLWMHKIWKF